MSVKLTWYGHSAWLLEADGTKILLDPFLNDNPRAPVDAEDVEADYILLSHPHFDHLGDAIPIAKRTGATVVANFETVGYVQDKGVENAHPLQHGGGRDFPFGRVKMTVAHHGTMTPDGTYGGNPCGFLIDVGDVRVYFAGDTALTYDMKLIGEEKPIDVALLPIGDNFTMGPDDAVRAVKLLAPKLVIPMHYDTFELIEQDPGAFQERVLLDTDAECHVLGPGESYEVVAGEVRAMS